MKRRHFRLIVPFAIVLLLTAFTLIAHAVQQPDPSDPAYLSPTSDEGVGAMRLAQRLTSVGVTVDVRKDSPGLLTAIGVTDGPVTVFVTTPEMVYPDYLRRLATLPARVRVVMVTPGERELTAAGLDVQVSRPRWAAATPEPGCATDFAEAGPAAVQRWRYFATEYSAEHCYNNGILDFRSTGFSRMTVVGAPDPFRNDRAGDTGNSDLAVALLARTPKLVWLDLHEREEPPPPSPSPTPEEPEAEPSVEVSQQPQEPGPAESRETSSAGGGTAEGDGGGGNPLTETFPPVVWATLLLLALAGVALALASARRLGVPVAEPLPARVRAAESVRGLGGLYRRARARDTSLEAVQVAARGRLAAHYGLPPTTGVPELIAHVAARTGQPEEEIRRVLCGGAGETDEELAVAATEVQNLVHWATGHTRSRGN